MSRPSAREMVLALYQGGMTDDEIAAATDVSQPTITRIRNGKHAEPRHSTWAAISDAYLKRQADKAVAGKAPRVETRQ